MLPEIISLIIIGAIALLLVGFVAARPQLRRQRLQRRFGPEYDHVIRHRRDRDAAESELLARERRHKELRLRPLDAQARERYRAEWTAVQNQFVDSPGGAAGDAERLVTEVMTDQGYPLEGHAQRLADLSVQHPRAVEHWRLASGISAERGGTTDVSTEELRQALKHYQAILDELLGAGGGRDGCRARDERDAARPHRVRFGDRIRHRAIRYTREHS